MNRVVVYCRVASKDQKDRKTIENQIEYAKKYADLHGLKIIDFYKDDGVSGLIPFEDRPEGSRLVKDAEDGKIDEVLIYKIDRLGRSISVVLNAAYLLEEKGIKLKSMTELFDTANIYGKSVLNILAGFVDMDEEMHS